MAGDLAERVTALRAALDEMPDAITFASLPPGLAPGEGPDDLPAGLHELLSMTNGPAGGAIVVFAAEEVAEQQFYPEHLQGGTEAWLCFGTVSDEPLMLRRDSGEVWWFPDTGTVYWMSDRFERLTPDVMSFAERYLFGPGYRELVPDEDDRWWQFLRQQDLA